MAPDAELRMNVYQEGQRAFNAKTPCPYTDWRAKTWEKGRRAAEAYEARFTFAPVTHDTEGPALNQQEVDTMSAALRAQGLTWAQTNFAVALVRNTLATHGRKA